MSDCRWTQFRLVSCLAAERTNLSYVERLKEEKEQVEEERSHLKFQLRKTEENQSHLQRQLGDAERENKLLQAQTEEAQRKNESLQTLIDQTKNCFTQEKKLAKQLQCLKKTLEITSPKIK